MPKLPQINAYVKYMLANIRECDCFTNNDLFSGKQQGSKESLMLKHTAVHVQQTFLNYKMEITQMVNI